MEKLKKKIDDLKIELGIEEKLQNKKIKIINELGISSMSDAQKYIDKKRREIKEIKNEMDKIEQECQNLLDEIE